MLSAAAPLHMPSLSPVPFLASAISVVRHLQGDDIVGGPWLQTPGTAASMGWWSKEAPAPLLGIALAVPGTTMAKGMVCMVAYLCAASA